MDLDPPSSSPRKVKFAPKGPPRKPARQIEPKIEEVDDGSDSREDKALLRRVNEHLTRRRPRAEKKSSVQVAFSHGVASNSIRSFGKQRERKDDQGNVTGLRDLASDGTEIPNNMQLTDAEICEDFTDSTSSSISKKKGEYREPWDYDHSYYPITLPLRRPYSGDPEIHDEAEFGKAAAKLEYDENATTSASDLGLLEKADQSQMLFLQFPPNLPFAKRPDTVSRRETADHLKSSTISETNQNVTAGNVPGVAGNSTGMKGKEIMGSSTYPGSSYGSRKGCSLEELPEGYMGKMLVYRSGAVKLKMGDVLYDVSPGSDCTFAQNVVAVNTVDQHCCELGEFSKRAVLTPDIDSLLDHVIDLG
ncbi:DNA-directed RNA polymerase III subunit rpc4-like [Olea europaea var. sylvestris]|uniref:DNA-directed RNA polymerase III subunit RPC4-like isoform X1 n=1 Tax=Olea europaea subsp. europaea TaxID=158383 RepID=A0A8S0TUZ0_OLEEU|nr:DNA-directed RNA polymerase III subunit rpc4-like [Olea europaea var. sylvestris]CAA3008737.1 DNA-directed RNA polymerase III subunit RPC4-like isoform X1 [Olea europaea subsp. europaea]